MTLIAPFSAAFQAANGPHGGLPVPPSPWTVHGLGAVPADRVWGDTWGPGFVLQPGQVGTLQLSLPAPIDFAGKRGAIEAEAERLGIWTRDMRTNGLRTIVWWQLGPRNRPMTSDGLGMVATHAIESATGVRASFVNMPGAPTASQPLGQWSWGEMTTWQKISRVASLVMVPVAAWHGYRRNSSVGWALAWGLAGGIAPFITGAVMVAQGPGKRANAGGGRRRKHRKHRARRHIGR